MRVAGTLLIAVCLLSTSMIAQAPSSEFQPVATMKQLMVEMIHPASNDILLAVNRGQLRSEQDWTAVRRAALALGESGNLLIIRNRASDWVAEARSLIDVGTAVYKAADAKDARAVASLTERVDASCTSCHKKFRPALFAPITNK
jgi:cytochrome c556